MTIPLQEGLVYGPVRSRRLGASLGVNILPDGRKVCNFNCPYCQYGWTPAAQNGTPAHEIWPTPESIAVSVDVALASADSVDRITLAGNGEPTLHPDFCEIVERLRTVRDRRARAAKLAILSNSSTVNDPEIAAGLARLDERYMKLDAGDAETLRTMNAAPVPIERVIFGLAALKDVVLQSLFTRDAGGKVDNTTLAALEHWLEAVTRIGPRAVHLYTIDRSPAWRPLQRVAREELAEIAERVRAIGIEAVVF